MVSHISHTCALVTSASVFRDSTGAKERLAVTLPRVAVGIFRRSHLHTLCGPGSRQLRRGEILAKSVSRQSKSLIENEAELSDWTRNLKTDSFHMGLSGEFEDSAFGRGKNIKKKGNFRGNIKGRERNSLSLIHGQVSGRRKGDINSDGQSLAPSKGTFRNQRGSSLKRRFVSDLDTDDLPGEKKGLEDRAGASSILTKNGGRDFESSSRSAQGKRRGATLLVAEDGVDDEEEEVDDDVMPVFVGETGGKEDFRGKVVKNAFLSNGVPFSSAGEISKAVVEGSMRGSESYLSQSRFDQCSLSPLSLKGIKAAGYERMTIVQEATLPFILKGKDVLAKAKTGTGKTLAFLLPAIEVVAKLGPVGIEHRNPSINVLVICPTRELADQAAAEAGKLLKYHHSIGVQVIMGGTKMAQEQKRIQANPCQILVATPGRLIDHIENTPGFSSRLMGIKVLVLDEADRLLDMGFRKDIEKVVTAVPKLRQTLLFSATIPDEVHQICYIAMKKDHEFIDTVKDGGEQTHSQVRQMHLIAPLDQQFSIVYSILMDHIAEDVHYKVIVFCTTAMVTRLVADLLAKLKLNVREIHSRKTQSYRTRVSNEFKESKGLILVSSDVSARGVDYPDVTLVMQMGLPADREQYIHRLGRTGRRGKEGKGILILAPWEDFFLDGIRDLPIGKAIAPLTDPGSKKRVEGALSHVEMKNKESAYQAWLGYYNSNKNIGRDKGKLVRLANEFSRSMGLENPPSIPMLVLRKMGLTNVQGLRSK